MENGEPICAQVFSRNTLDDFVYDMLMSILKRAKKVKADEKLFAKKHGKPRKFVSIQTS